MLQFLLLAGFFLICWYFSRNKTPLGTDDKGWRENVNATGLIRANLAQPSTGNSIVRGAAEYLNACSEIICNRDISCHGHTSNNGNRYVLNVSGCSIRGFVVIRGIGTSAEVIFSNHGKSAKRFKTSSLIDQSTLNKVLEYITTPASRWDNFLYRNNTGSSASEWE